MALFPFKDFLDGTKRLYVQPAAITGAPVAGTKTVTAVAAEIFAGGSRKTGRYGMMVYNASDNPIYWGPTGVSTSTGFPIFPDDIMAWSFAPDIATPIFLVAEVNSSVKVVELS